MPWTLRAFPTGSVPTPTFETRRVSVLAVPETFATELNRLGVVTEFETYTFPWTVRAFAFGAVPTPIFETTTRENVFSTPETFVLTTMAFVVVSVFDTTIFPGT